MIAKPTTEQLLNSCSRELMEVVLPAVGDDTVKVTVMMLDVIIRNAAIRAAHEIAWMTDEITQLEALAGAPAPTDGQSLHLDDVVERYCRASEAFSAVLEAAVASGDRDVIRRGKAILDQRVAREDEAMAGWSPVGR